MSIDVNVSAEEHFCALRSQGEAYLSKALRGNAPPVMRQRLLEASLRFLGSRSRANLGLASQMSHASQGVMFSQATAASGPGSSFQSLLACALDQDISADALMEACAKAADSQLLPILVKCLFVLSSIGSIRDNVGKEDGDGLASQSQYEDEELFGIQDIDEENVNPQTGKLAKAKPGNAKPILGKRKNVGGEISVGRTGQSFVDEFVSRLVSDVGAKSSRGSRSNDIFISSVARESPLSESASRNILRLLTRRMRRVDVFELPPFIYQLLLFASARGNSSSKSEVLINITQVFADLEKKSKRNAEISQNLLDDDEDAILSSCISLSDLRQVQGTALLHIEYAVKQDPTLCAEMVKLARSGVETPRHFLTSFGSGMILTLASSTTAHSDVLHILRESILKFKREMALRKSSLYAARVSMNDETIIDPSESLIYVADCTRETGWDYVKESLVNFALLLLDKPIREGHLGSSEVDLLGEELLCKLFKAHSVIRSTILEQLTTRIALQEKSAQPAIFVLGKLAKDCAYDIQEHTQYIRDGIEMLPTLPPWMASTLIDAYKPLLYTRTDLRDYFQLVIRKSLFRRDSPTRAVAINGFLVIMSLGSLSKKENGNALVGNSEISSQQKAFNVDDILDAVQPLRRIFSYPAPLRALLYKNSIHALQDTEGKQASKMSTALDEVLRCHLRSFVSPEAVPYVVLDHCVNESTGGLLVEPLGDLIWCLAVVESKRDPSSYEKSYIIDLAKKLASVSIQDFSVSKETLIVPPEEPQPGPEDDGSPSPEECTARANRNKLRILGSVCEALVHAILIIPPDSQTWSIYPEVLVPLLSIKSKVFELLRGAGASSPGDAFNDLGGDLSIERLRPGMRMYLHRGGKSVVQKGKKGSTGKKGKGADNSSGLGSGVTQVSDHRFGSFNVLSSASSRPTLSLHVAMRTLRLMSDACNQINGETPNVFQGQVESRDFLELRMYLLAVVQKHVEDFISTMSKDCYSETCNSEDGVGGFVSKAIEDLVKMAMNDFKQFRRSPSSANSQGGIAALQIAERCACALNYLRKRDKSRTASFCSALMPSPSLVEHTSPEEIFEAAVEALEQLVESLVEDESFKEAALVIRMHDAMIHSIVESFRTVEKQSAFIEKRVLWATDVVALKPVRDCSIVKTLLTTCLEYTENNNDLRRAGHLCERLHEVLGDCDENAEAPERDEDSREKLSSAQSVQKETAFVVVDAILELIDRGICDVEWCLGRMISLECAVGNSSVEVDSSHCKESSEQDIEALQQEAAAKQAIRAEDAAQVRLEGIVRSLAGLARCAIGKWVQQERLLKLITKAYKVICSATQAQSKRRGDPRTTFTSLIDVCKGLGPTLWTYLAFVGSEKAEDRTTKGPSRAAREARVVPQLVYEVERFEKVLIATQKRTKINLLRGMRRNIARDFRIREDRLQEENNSENEEDRENGEMEGEEKGSSRTKRRRS